MSQTRERYFEWTLLGLILVLGGILFYQAQPFLNGALGAITLYILLRRVNFYLIRKTSEKWAPWIITLVTLLFVLIPLSLGTWYIIDLIQHQSANIDFKAIVDKFNILIQHIEERTGWDLVSDKSIAFVTARCTAIANMMVSGINNFAINIFTALLLLFFLLAGGMRMEMNISQLLPFNEKNKRIIVTRISSIVRSNAIGIPLLAMIQGAVSAICYWLCSVSNPIEFGILTGFASMIPIVGTMLVWVPLTVSQYFALGFGDALQVALCGILIISQCDNVLRMIMQKKMANTHPLITIFGVIAGLPIFGFMGLIFGPLMVAMFLLFLDLFAHQYIQDPSHTMSLARPAKPIRQPKHPKKESALKQALRARFSSHLLKYKQKTRDLTAHAGSAAVALVRRKFPVLDRLKPVLHKENKQSERSRNFSKQRMEAQSNESATPTATKQGPQDRQRRSARQEQKRTPANAQRRTNTNRNPKAENKERKRQAARQQQSQEPHLRQLHRSEKQNAQAPLAKPHMAPLVRRNAFDMQDHRNLISRAVTAALNSLEPNNNKQADPLLSAAQQQQNAQESQASQKPLHERTNTHERKKSRNEHRNHKRAENESRSNTRSEHSSAKAEHTAHRNERSGAKADRRGTHADKKTNNRAERRNARNKHSKENFAQHAGYRNARTQKKNESPFVHTVVSSKFGGKKEEHNGSHLKTELISKYTVKGTEHTEALHKHGPKRHPSRKRPFHH